jgi:SAM domain (Sterile alpha motif)
MDIRAWLQVARTREQTFRNNESDRRILPELTADDLKELGVGAIGHRRLL